MTVLPQHTQRIIFHKAMASAHLIAAEFDCSASDVIDIVVGGLLTPETRMPVSTPSQPNPPPSAAQTDGAAESSSLPTEPSVDLSGLAAHEQGPIPSPAVPTAGDAADGQAETLLSKPSVAPPPKAKRKMAYARVKEAFEANPSGTATQIAASAGVHVSTAGTWLKQLRKDLADKTTEALKAPPAKPQDAAEPPQAPETQPEPEQPPAAKYEPVLPPVQRDVSDVLHRTARAPQGRFYLRDKATLLFVHQSLQPSPSGPGPLMTSDRKWAWYDTMERFRGAMKKWPELANLRKEAASQ